MSALVSCVLIVMIHHRHPSYLLGLLKGQAPLFFYCLPSLPLSLHEHFFPPKHSFSLPTGAAMWGKAAHEAGKRSSCHALIWSGWLPYVMQFAAAMAWKYMSQAHHGQCSAEHLLVTEAHMQTQRRAHTLSEAPQICLLWQCWLWPTTMQFCRKVLCQPCSARVTSPEEDMEYKMGSCIGISHRQVNGGRGECACSVVSKPFYWSKACPQVKGRGCAPASEEGPCQEGKGAVESRRCIEVRAWCWL